MTTYFLYARKSTDVEDKQVRSIEDQLAVLRALAKEQNISIVREIINNNPQIGMILHKKYYTKLKPRFKAGFCYSLSLYLSNEERRKDWARSLWQSRHKILSMRAGSGSKGSCLIEAPHFEHFQSPSNIWRGA